jgi:nucleotide-binding universal stress UspA family protein
VTPGEETVVTWPKLNPPENPDGYVLFGLSRPDTVAGVTRVAVLMSHYYGALPLAIHVALGEEPTWEGHVDLEGERLFDLARTEAHKLGFPLRTYSEFGADAAAGIRQAAETHRPHALVLGRSFGRGARGFVRTAVAAAGGGAWPLIVARLTDFDQFSSLLVPLTDPSDPARLQPILHVLGKIVALPMTFLLLTGAGADGRRRREKLVKAAAGLSLEGTMATPEVPEEGMVASILSTAAPEDLIVLHAGSHRQPKPPCSSSLAENVAERTDHPVLLVHGDLRARVAGNAP